MNASWVTRKLGTSPSSKYTTKSNYGLVGLCTMKEQTIFQLLDATYFPLSTGPNT